ncbi:hypothetical protein [Methylorubrum suomiense]|uniref:Uncharacterized protein n=1 Tax=Methylorubrum suomiense TaxID=144191 RepID=A0ABQ4V3H9_9HYPH|nr:hypothetical protein [Methylorubrum suomiense]GJE78114.1 hypothetical protein BGCPKDLD_4725 [Methylorubrum suomiense]
MTTIPVTINGQETIEVSTVLIVERSYVSLTMNGYAAYVCTVAALLIVTLVVPVIRKRFARS